MKLDETLTPRAYEVIGRAVVACGSLETWICYAICAVLEITLSKPANELVMTIRKIQGEDLVTKLQKSVSELERIHEGRYESMSNLFRGGDSWGNACKQLMIERNILCHSSWTLEHVEAIHDVRISRQSATGVEYVSRKFPAILELAACLLTLENKLVEVLVDAELIGKYVSEKRRCN